MTKINYIKIAESFAQTINYFMLNRYKTKTMFFEEVRHIINDKPCYCATYKPTNNEMAHLKYMADIYDDDINVVFHVDYE